MNNNCFGIARVLLILAMIAVLLLITPAGSVSSLSANPPCRFYGTVQVDGYDVPDGTVITTIIEGVPYSTTTPEAAYGPSTYALKIEHRQALSIITALKYISRSMTTLRKRLQLGNLGAT